MVQSIRDVMTPDPISIPVASLVAEAARAMRDVNIGDVSSSTTVRYAVSLPTEISWSGLWRKDETSPPPMLAIFAAKSSPQYRRWTRRNRLSV